MASSVIGNPSDQLMNFILGRMRFGEPGIALTDRSIRKRGDRYFIAFEVRIVNDSYDAAELEGAAVLLISEEGKIIIKVPVLEERCPVLVRAYQTKRFEIEIQVEADQIEKTRTVCLEYSIGGKKRISKHYPRSDFESKGDEENGEKLSD